MGPLSIAVNTTETKTSVPMFQENVYVPFRFSKVNQDHVEGKGDVIKFEFDLVEPAANQDGGTIRPGDFGSKVFVSVQLYDKNQKPGDGPPQWAISKLAKIQDAFLGTGDPDNKKGKPARGPFDTNLVPQLIGTTAFLKFKNKTGEFVGQDVASFTYPGDVAGA